MRGPALALCLILYGASHAAHQEAVPPVGTATPVTLTVRIPGERRQFRPGEIIPIQLEFTSPVPKRFVVDRATYDRSGRLTLDDFLIEPNEGVSDPLLDLYAAGGGFIGGGLRGMGVLGEQPVTVDLDLNDWFRFDQPGIYRVSVRSRRVTDDTQRGARHADMTVESNEVTLEMLPRDAEWEARQLAAARQVLESKVRDANPKNACRTLRFLGTNAAADELVKRYDDTAGGCAFEYMAGLFTAFDRDYVVRRMEAGLRASERAVTRNYLRTLSILSAYRDHPELRPAQTRETKGRMPRGEDLGRPRERIAAAQARYAAVVAAALPDKTASARAIILAEGIDTIPGAASSAAAGDDERKRIAENFPALPADRQSGLLGYEWRRIRGPEMLPVLRTIVSNGATEPPALLDVALRRLYELAPDEGRALILQQIRNPSPGMSLKTLGALPDRELPGLDEALMANLDGDARVFELAAELLQRYASAGLAPRVHARFDASVGHLSCRPQAALLAYFTRVDEKTGALLLDRALTARGQTSCFKRVLPDVAAHHMSDAIEAAAIAHLDDAEAEVVAGAAETLGRFGSAAAVQPLRARLERWSAAWRGREDELRFSYARPESRSGAAQGMVEWRLVEALGKGRAWLTTRETLDELRVLCVTDNCRQQLDRMKSEIGHASIQVTGVDESDHAFISIAQYDLSSLAALEEKLAQYPRGTSFTLNTGTLDAGTAAIVTSRLQKIADAHGITLR